MKTKARLVVIKSDGSSEPYMHTKVLHTIDRALAGADEHDPIIAEKLAEVITYFLYNEKAGSTVSSSEILAAIKVVLTATGHDSAAELLSEHHYQRRLKRNRIEVFKIEADQTLTAEQLLELQQHASRSLWSKSAIVDYLVEKQHIDRNNARAIAAMVEEKILAMHISKVPTSLIKQLVLSCTASVLQAQRQFQAV